MFFRYDKIQITHNPFPDSDNIFAGFSCSNHDDLCPALLKRIYPRRVLAKTLCLIPKNLQSHGHSTRLMPQNVTMQCPDTLIVCKESYHSIT